MPLTYETQHDNLDSPDDDSLRARAIAGLDNSGHGIAVFNPKGRMCFGNNTFLKAFSSTPNSEQTWAAILVARSAYEQSGTAGMASIDAFRLCEQGSHQDNQVQHFSVNLANGRCWWITETMDRDGWLTVSATDITSLKAHEQALQRAHDEAVRAANTDELTGIYNRRYILNRLEKAIAEVNVARSPFCICLLDLDHFKEINDTYGHAAGDHVIRHLTVEAQRHLRPTDELGRIGGEEFLLLLPNTTVPEAHQIIDRLRGVLSSASPALAAPGFRYTFSAGITMGQRGDTGENVLQRADCALYEAKRKGRDRHFTLTVIPAQPEQCQDIAGDVS